MAHTGCVLGPLLFSGPPSFVPIIFHVLKDTTQGNADGGAGAGQGWGSSPHPHRPPAGKLSSPVVGASWAPVQGLWLMGSVAAGPWLLVLSSLSTLSRTPGRGGRS